MTDTDILPDRGHNNPPDLLPVLPLDPDAEKIAQDFRDFLAKREKPMPNDLPYDAQTWFSFHKRVSDFCDAAGAWSDLGRIDSDVQSQRLTDFVTGARGLAKQVEDTRKAQKQPHSDRAAAVDKAFNPLKDKLELVTSKMKAMQADWLVRENARIAAEKAEAARIAAEKLADAQKAAAEAEARNDISGTIDAEAALKDAAKEAKAAEKQVSAKAGSATGAGKAMSLRDVVEVQVVSIGKAIMHFKDAPELLELIKSLAAREARAKGFDPKTDTIPGIEISVRQVAV